MPSRPLRAEVVFLVLALALFAAIPLGLAAYPAATGDIGWDAVAWRTGFDGRVPDVVLRIAIFAMMALGLNVVIGYTGQLDLGYVAFMATGMVVTVVAMSAVVVPEDHLAKILATPNGKQNVVDVGGYFQIPTSGFNFKKSVPVQRPMQFDGSILVVMLASGLVCAAMGVLRGLPTLRLVGDYYAIVTLGFAEILNILFRSVRWTGGTMGISLSGPARPSMWGEPLKYNTPQFYYLVWASLSLAVAALLAIRESRLGRALAAIRLDPVAAQTCGVHVGRYKILAYAVSGFIGGVGGSLFAVLNGMFSTTSIDFTYSILLVAILVLGGMGSVRGALVGSVVMVGLGELLREKFPIPQWPPGSFAWISPKPEARWLFYGVVLIAMMRFRPEGLLPHRTGVTAIPTAVDRARRAAARLFNLDPGAKP